MHYPITQLLLYVPCNVRRTRMVSSLVANGSTRNSFIVDHKTISTPQFMVMTDSTDFRGARATNFVSVNENGIFSASGGAVLPGFRLCASITSTALRRAGWLRQQRPMSTHHIPLVKSGMWKRNHHMRPARCHQINEGIRREIWTTHPPQQIRISTLYHQ